VCVAYAKIINCAKFHAMHSIPSYPILLSTAPSRYDRICRLWDGLVRLWGYPRIVKGQVRSTYIDDDRQILPRDAALAGSIYSLGNVDLRNNELDVDRTRNCNHYYLTYAHRVF